MSQSESYELIIINNVICLLNLRRELKNGGVVWNLLNWTIAANPQSIRKLSVTIPTPLIQECSARPVRQGLCGGDPQDQWVWEWLPSGVGIMESDHQ